MEKNIARQVLENPKFQKMAKTKSMYCWSYSALMFVIYVIFIMYIGTSPESFGTPVSEGSTTTVGIYVGLFVILFAIAITGVYVRQANGPLEVITQDVVSEVLNNTKTDSASKNAASDTDAVNAAAKEA
ncbi:DUF485 domain-containing protein [Vitreoscilla stercoraria]|uniref:DUF485 domain-containing protein n=1 Tax=Vitreoscilla stercoraria TaxID=61 RepID=A0ABY4E8E6_VITST|nr:DUF485 domain-containing protein [Vitreoscilla stercoraria]UOO91618.1 DUF485 domain-containing protein [Vitreoscilla stercoraria]